MSPEEMDEHDLTALLDGALTEEERRAAQLRLARRPEAAAQAMADLAVASALREAHPLPDPPAGARGPARRLQGALRAPSRRRRIAQAAAVAAVFLGGWLAGTAKVGVWDGAPHLAPGFVDEAVMSHRTALVRAKMASQPEITTLDAREINHATQIALPAIPRDWRVTDAQVYPSDEGPSVGLAFRSPQGPVSLFGFHTHDQATIPPTTVRRGGDYVTYWRTRDMAFALIGPPDPRELGRMAASLAAHAPGQDL
jgi:anti-sigma factor RsiW